jgi:methylmalonyl-CoA mutase N-terminal domain/subunit
MTAQDGSGREQWAAAFAEAEAMGQVRDADFTTISGVEVDPVYGPDDEAADGRMERIGWPGQFPFTRGLYPSGYRGRPGPFDSSPASATRSRPTRVTR